MILSQSVCDVTGNVSCSQRCVGVVLVVADECSVMLLLVVSSSGCEVKTWETFSILAGKTMKT